MKKNAFLTFIFACIPGAGQMYYGYMKRGTSLLVYFCLFIMLGAIISPLVVGVAVVYMFSFFDTYDLIRYLVAGDPKPDEFLLPPDWQNQLGGAKAKMTPKMNKIIGWCLLLTGVYVMYDSVVWPIVSNILQQLGVYWDIIYTLNNAIPSVVVAVLLIVFGGRCWALANMPTTTIPTTCPRTRAEPAKQANLKRKLKRKCRAGCSTAPRLVACGHLE